MAENKKKTRVVTRRGGAKEKAAGIFSFTQDMIPSFSNGTKEAAYFSDYRSRAWKSFQELSLPNTTEEAWRRTDIRKLDTESFKVPDKKAADELPAIPKKLLQPLAEKEDGGRISLAPGGASLFLAPELQKQGVVFTDLETAAREHAGILEKALGNLVRPEESKFAAMAGALSRQGVLLYVPKGVDVELPLHSVLWAPGAGLAYFSHLLIYLDEASSATYIHEAASPDEEQQSLHAGIVEIYVGGGANLRFVEEQSLGAHFWNFTHERAKVERSGSIDWIVGSLGSYLSKNFSEIDLAGEGATARMSGFYFTDGHQHLDHDTQQNHNAPHTTSDLLFKGALAGQSRSVWQGMIYVAPNAQKTDGYQRNPNLILSDKARADSIPGLEILADDVRCTHGATVGKIDPEELFYLRSRGIPEKDAEQLIVEGFFDPIMQRIPIEGVRSRFQTAIVEKFNR